MSDDAAIRALAGTLVEALTVAGKTVTAAESCTGGWIAKALTDVPGSSACFGVGIVSYSDAGKQTLVGVRDRTLADHGAVSEEVVREMAIGALAIAGADLAVAVSGIAGPGGGTDAKPVGTVWFAWALRRPSRLIVESECRRFDGDREAIRRQTVFHALDGLKERLVT